MISFGTVKLWDVEKRELITTLESGDAVYSVAFSPDGTILASGGHEGIDGTVRLWDVATYTNIATLRFSSIVTSVAFSS